ncbi:signal transduction histidine kinase [Arcticibacter tournemirensis]|uniref:histidine kinase n=1 Tax=Arcticibacter tournemirensis TaxID=699437 RepID=A0A5M9GL74_9SPHI|nr:ATP-binding protein [Arcticibacter tournemirensis]KAA8475442.1 response regulator [Arcticibacter tournemirensis]TQM51761.1 signal transduction histidine kinase [Arcticibacter tournemirensis]
MLVFGTEMHIVTSIFVCLETVILFYLATYKLARPDDKTATLNMVLISLLIVYNVTGGLLPDPDLPGSFFLQEIIAYATGFITPCYFPYYVYQTFGLEKMRFHAYKGVYIFLVVPYLIFVMVFAESGDLATAQQLLILPVLYALWVIYTLIKAVQHKYNNNFSSKESKTEIGILFFSLTPWIGLPFIAYFNQSQVIEASITNTGFLLLFGLQVSRHIQHTRLEHQRLIESELLLLNWNTNLQEEVDKRTQELEKLNEQRTNNFINLVHETKTPLTLVNNYLEEYINKYGSVAELDIIKGGIDKMTNDITNLFDLERFTKGFSVYDHNQITDFSEILKNSFTLFEYYCQKQNLKCIKNIEENVLLKANSHAIYRIVNNLIENAIKFSNTGGLVEVTLKSNSDKLLFSVKDSGIGILPHLQHKIFKPYYQIGHKKSALQGMGLGLPIVKKVTDSLGGRIQVESNPAKKPGTTITITLDRYNLKEGEAKAKDTSKTKTLIYSIENFDINDTPYVPDRQSILLIEDNKAMLHFLYKKLSLKYNIFCSLNGSEALKKLETLPTVPDLILSDIMMDKMDGFEFVKIISEQANYGHIPIIFLSARSTPTDKLKGLRLGAIDFIQKPFSFEVLYQKIETVLNTILKQKKAILDASISNLKVLSGQEINTASSTGLAPSLDQKCKLYQLTNREIEIVKLILKGTQYKTIAKTLFISEKTVSKHIQNIFEKVNVTNKVELINKLNS